MTAIGKFRLEYHNSAEEEEDENWRAWAELMTAIGKFRLEYHNAAEEDDDNMNFRWRWGPVDIDLELNEDKKVEPKKGLRKLLEEYLKEHPIRPFRPIPPPIFKPYKPLRPFFGAKPVVAPKKNIGFIPWYKYIPIYQKLQEIQRRRK
ncbi:hypothetical protein TVAG_351730 [Trichomonas vaginalis G3]|uniref:Uncharacterized protein n=1 Tax=Trichomonas vaginalis (strain ATCC PRA-98 / G3) TaxID=412133 RepID=A2DZQ7_TRIV3|nr:hypothetical protein TVAGG3_0261290 [Trichomonas vaginalis G3]EAY14125.1 hypothetical protein TVAG_351730 [Trichomonas vaginalis G3]KAI5525134.1 hypothetical protein TVAGG3_0261290 [Trichomonas vaginalis G3]|eukprot:XP_001326348.1 hypothetical protein [Trichomonas vaginalis G3]